MNEKRNVLLIGGGGYIGPVIAENLLQSGFQVTCLDLLLYENIDSMNDLMTKGSFKFIKGDFCDKTTLRKSLVGISDVVLLAGLVGDPITKKYPLESSIINDKGIIECIEELGKADLKQVILVSTCSNYGLIESDKLANEDFPLAPLSHYAKSKVNAEKYLLGNMNEKSYSPTVLRFATAFGIAPRMRFDLTVNEFTRELALGRTLKVFDADTWRPYCHVEDFARLVSLVLMSPREKVGFEVFNAGGDANNSTKRSIVTAIQDSLPNAKVEYATQGSDKRNYKVDFMKIRQSLGFEPVYSINDGITEILEAIGQGNYLEVESKRNFYGNYEIRYHNAS
jgi:nucleoside-diphosphate-sugar epimerase